MKTYEFYSEEDDDTVEVEAESFDFKSLRRWQRAL